MMSKKIRVAILYGGKSGEHEVSLMSAHSIMRHIDTERFDAVPIGIDKNGDWNLNDPKAIFSEDRRELLIKTANSRPISIPDSSLPIDVVFPVLHGPLGEDGCVQGVFECSNLAYVGAGVLGSALAMDKSMAKTVIQAAGIPIPRFITALDYFPRAQLGDFYKKITQQLGDLIFVKPARLGSSVGISRVTNREQFIAAFELAAHLDSKIIIEEGVKARELELSVLDNPHYGQPPLVSIAGEIIPSEKHQFYSYDAKYVDADGAQLIAPADLTPEQLQACQAVARDAYRALDCEGMARVDLFMEHGTGRILLNEINTIPGFTSISMYPRLWEASGLGYSNLISCLIDLAMARHQRRQQLITDYQMIRL